MVKRAALFDVILMTTGRMTFVGLWFLAILLVYRDLGTSPDGRVQAGLFAISIACVKVASGLLSDPLDLALMRRVPPLLHANARAAFEVLRAAVGLRIGAALFIGALLAIFAGPLATLLLGQPDAVLLVRFVAAAIVSDAVFRSVLVVLLVREQFRYFVALESLLQGGRFAAIVVLWATDQIRVELVLACYAAVPLCAALFAFALVRGGLFDSLRTHTSNVLDLLNYLKWMVPAMVLAAVNERLDLFLVYSFKGAASAGSYGFVLTIALIPDIVSGCLSTILQPRIVRIYTGGEYAETIRRFLLVSVPLCALAYLAALTLAEPLISLVFGTRYLDAMPALYWLLAGTLFWLAVTPLPLTLVAIITPQRIVLVTLGQSAIVLLGGVLLLPQFGLVGMAQAIFGMRVAIALAIVIAAHSMKGSAAPAVPGMLPP